jgi:serine/threonine-protein kinase
VSLWDRFSKKPASTPAPPEAASPPPQVERPEIGRLRETGAAGGPTADEALALFRSLRASADEARAIDAVRFAAGARPIPESIRVAVAAALADRGEQEGALALVAPASGATSPEARVLAADLRAERGEIAEALALIERVLVVSFDYPGARERHARWRSELGIDAGPGARHDASATATVVTREPDAPFLLLREVARGGAGAVYEAEDRDLRRRVALKVYHHADRDRDQLLHEARVAASLLGQGVIRVLDVDPEHGWLALEWAPLGSLREHLRAKSAPTLNPIARWALPLAAALARVHAAGWVHHDVKPANVLLGAIDRPILADFGSARRTAEPSPPGSLGYVSPERLSGRKSDPRDDVFGYGRILEDALAALAPLGPTPDAWREIAAACTGPDGSRPSDARALVTRLRVEAASTQDRPGRPAPGSAI